MFWRGNLDDVGKLIKESVKDSVAAEMAPMRVTVSQLTESTTRQAAKMESLMVNHATRGDLEKIRAEMQQGFSQLSTQYMPLTLANTRFEALQTEIADLKKHDDRQGERGFTLGMQAVGWLIGGLATVGMVISIVIAITK
jgi:hypothetical protein